MLYLSSIAFATAYPSANHPYNIRTDGLSLHTTFDDLQKAQRNAPPINAPPIEQLRKELDLAVKKHSAFWNVSLSVAIHGGADYELAVAAGTDDYISGTNFTTDLRIPMGSTTKLYTAAILLQLVEQGKLNSLDDPVAPLINAYLATPAPCSEMPSWCLSTCAPLIPCAKVPPPPGCKPTPPEVSAACSYCLRYSHCPPTNATLTLEGVWGQTEIGKVTFRQLVGMTSGLKDYYYDTSQWLYKTVMSVPPRDVEPLEYLMHMDKSFLFSPGEANRAAYSTNGFSLVGLALAGLFRYDDWAKVDQRTLAWGKHLPADDATMFATRGTCSSYPKMAMQYASGGTRPYRKDFFSINSQSCLNSWLGGNIAARPLDVARFMHAVFSTGGGPNSTLLSADSLKQMTTLKCISDGFAAHTMGYGLGLEASCNGTQASFQNACGLTLLSHGGLDYGSGGVVNGFLPEIGLGISVAAASAMEYGSTTCGKQCKVSYTAQPKMQTLVAEEVLAILSKAFNRSTPCQTISYQKPDPKTCTDAPYFGIVNGKQTSCDSILQQAASASHQPPGSYCDSWLGTYTIGMLKTVWAPKYHLTYSPPPGFPDSTIASDLCKATCLKYGTGPCWLAGPQTPWCNA